jgi:hypothetical protein
MPRALEKASMLSEIPISENGLRGDETLLSSSAEEELESPILVSGSLLVLETGHASSHRLMMGLLHR